jgi:outer membrane protein OmpA-like peptidoglycan-associated protein
VLLAATSLHAQVAKDLGEGASFSAERLRPSMDRDGILDVEWANIDDPGTYDAALWLNYAYNPMVLNLRNIDGTSTRVGSLIQHRVGASVVAATALFDWLEVGGEIPLVLFQTRGSGVPGLDLGDLNAVGIGDLRVAAKIQALQAKDAVVDVAILPQLTLPTGFPGDSYLGEGAPTFAPEVLVSRRIKEIGLRVAGNVGVRVRPETQTFGLTVSQELTWRVAAGYGLRQLAALPVELEASLSGGTALLRPFVKTNQMPMELLAGATYEAIPDLVQVLGGFGLGVVGGFGTPDFRLFASVRFAPRDHDKDKDGIVDDEDDCPLEPEDKDGFQDSDGCPDPDNDGDGVLDKDDMCPLEPGPAEFKGCPGTDKDGDGIVDALDKCPEVPEDDDEWQDEDGCPDPDNDEDGILDANDKCPYDPEDKDGYEDIDGCPEDDNDGDGILDDKDECDDEPEDMDGDKDEDGCPDNARIVVTKKKVFALEKIYFEFGKADIQAQSYGILDEVARVLNENPEVGRIRIEGHTDDKGSDSFNLTLSQARTDSVRKYLINKGVPADRLDAVGYGETRPIADNATPEGREKNRRVEFVLIDQAPPAPAPEPAPAPAPAPP